MLELKAARFFRAALQSGLIDEAGLAACFELIPPEKRTPDAIDRRLARQAIATGRLTLWQAQQILSGRSSGYKIDKYVLLDLLGRGGMGRVYLAKDLKLNRMVALKILSAERMNNPRAIARFHREAKVGAQLQHENLVRVYDYNEGESDNVRYLVMEYIEGKNVGQLIGELGAIPWPTAARLGRQIALGLEHARLKELIHRDVNPCNILVTRDGTAKLTDLGLAIDLNDHENVTRDGATVGTFDYVSPEQARHSRSVDTRADIYSLGCSLYHMVAGRVPFPVASLPEKLYAHQLHDPDPLETIAPGTPEGLSDVIRKMMRKQPEDRYQTPLEVAQALEPFAVETGWISTAPAPSAGTDPVARPTEVAAGLGGGAAGPGPGEVAEIPLTWATSLNINLEHGRGSHPGSGPNRTPNSSASGPESSSPTPAAGAFFPVDLGPDEALAAGLNPQPKPKPWLKPRSEAEPEPASASDPATGSATPAWVPSRRFRAIAAGIGSAVAVVGVVAALAMLSLFGPGFGGKPGGDGEASTKSKVVKKPVRGDIVVLYRDGDSVAAKSLTEAIAAASSRVGAEVLLGGTTVRVDNAKTLRVADGSLTIRAAEASRPVLEVVVKGSRPMFLLNANLRLEGLTVVVRYESPSDAPVFQAEREMTLNRCVFRAIGPPEGSRFALAEGRKASVDGCLFEGFETALDIEANPGVAVTLKRSIFLSARPGEEAIGRVVRFHSIYGQGSGVKLSVESCSARASTFLDVNNFSTTTPLQVDVTGSAFLVRTLVSLEGESKAPIGSDGALRWKGLDNRYKVTGPAWATFADAPVNLEAWAKLTGESGGKAQELKLAKEPPDPATPKDCGLLDEADKPVGADPTKVGPG